MQLRSENVLALLGGGDVVHLQNDAVPPVSGPDSILIRMLFAPVNPADLLTVDGKYPFPLGTVPVLGGEGVGIVEVTGSAVATVAQGDLVLPLSRGNWCRYRLLREQEVIRVPAGIAARQAAMLRINPLTAQLLLREANVSRGGYLIQNAASSSVAHWLRVFARDQGVGVLNVARSTSNAMLPNCFEDGPDLAERIWAKVAPEQVHGALDCVGGTATGRLANCVSQGGRIIVFGHLSGEPAVIPTRFLTGKGLMIKGFSLRPAEASMSASIREQAFAKVFAAASDPANHMAIREIIPIEKIQHALQLARQAGSGRVLVSMGG